MIPLNFKSQEAEKCFFSQWIYISQNSRDEALAFADYEYPKISKFSSLDTEL